MHIDFTRYNYTGQWFEFKGARLKIRPCPASMKDIVFRPGQGAVISGADGLKVFAYCLEAWENVEDASGVPIPLTDQNKKTIFDFEVMGIPEFVLGKVREMDDARLAAEKN